MRDLAFNFFHRDIWKQELQLRAVTGLRVSMGLLAGFARGTERDTGSQFLPISSPEPSLPLSSGTGKQQQQQQFIGIPIYRWYYLK